MTIELQQTLEREMKDALAIDDPERRREAVNTVQNHIMLALLDCQRKTAERVKGLVAQDEERKQKIAGAKILAGILKAVMSVGGPGAAIYILKVLGAI